MRRCLITNCEKTHHCRGFCRSHYNQWYKGWLTDNGERTEYYNGNKNREVTSCLINDCSREPKKKAFCEKHYKWWRKGYCTDEGTIIKKPKPQRYSSIDKCKIPKCNRKPRRNGLCERCSPKVRAGTLNLDGTPNWKKVTLKYAEDTKCIKCGKGGKITKRFCKTHYTQFSKGIIDEKGNQIRKRKRILRYAPDATCRIADCNQKPRIRGFCNNHGIRYNNGTIDEYGNPIPCKEENCSKPAGRKGLCISHRRLQLKQTSVVHNLRKMKELTCSYCEKTFKLLHKPEGLPFCNVACEEFYNKLILKNKKFKPRFYL